MDPIDQRELFEDLRTRLIGHLKTEKAIALALGMIPQTFNMQYLYAKGKLTDANVTMYEVLFKLKKIDSGYGGKSLMEGIFIELERRLRQSGCPLEPSMETRLLLIDMPHFERFEASRLDPAWKRPRRGRPAKKGKNKKEMCATWHTFKGRTVDYIREKYGLGGKKRYKETEAIWKERRKDLMKAVQEGLLTVSQAHTCLVEDREKITALLHQGKKAIDAFFREKRCAEKRQENFSVIRP